MRRLLLVALVGCGADGPASTSASIMLDIPNAALDPKGYTSVEVKLRDASGETVRSAAVVSGAFDLGDFDPRSGVSIEAVLRNDSGAAVGYGRTPAALDLIAGETITVQVRRPIVYIAGLKAMGSQSTRTWFGVPATFSDLSTGEPLDGNTLVGDKPVLMIAAGPMLYAINQAASSPDGTLTGTATISPISTGDHTQGAPIPGAMTGAVQDGAGSDDGRTLIVGTSDKLFVVDTSPEAAAPVREIAAGSFGRVAMIAGRDGGLGAIAIRNRVSTTGACSPTAELWWIQNTGGEVVDARMIATGGFADVASDGGRAWYVDACKGELGEALATGVRAVRADLGRPTALAVSNGQAWIGLEASPTLSLVVTPVEASTGAPRTLWTERQQQVLAATDYPGVERLLTAQSATFQQLEVGAGGDYIAASATGSYYGGAIIAANFPEMNIQTDELRVFDAASGGIVHRYRSWCDGFYRVALGDIDTWECSLITGQTAPAVAARRHRIQSMTTLFGKK